MTPCKKKLIAALDLETRVITVTYSEGLRNKCNCHCYGFCRNYLPFNRIAILLSPAKGKIEKLCHNKIIEKFYFLH